MKCSELYKILTKDGWYPVSQKGSHENLSMTRNWELSSSQIMEARRLEKDLREKFLKMLG